MRRSSSSPPPPEPHSRDRLVRERAQFSLKPDGNKAIVGLAARIEHDGYWLHGSRVTPLVLHELDEDGAPVSHEIEGDVWVDRGDVLYVTLLPPAAL